MKTFVRIDGICGQDWHDTYEKTNYLRENGSLEISNPIEVIYNYIKDTVMNFSAGYFKSMDFECIATDEAIKEALVSRKGELTLYAANGEEYTYANGETVRIYEQRYVLNAETLEVHGEILHGQITDNFYISIMEIEDDAVRYLAVENFLCPNKGVPSVQRFYSLPVKTQAEVEKLLDEMVLHTPKNSKNVWAESAKEIVIDNVDNLLSSSWYARNIIALKESEVCKEFINKYADDSEEVPFAMYAEKHTELLKEKADAVWKAHVDQTLKKAS